MLTLLTRASSPVCPISNGVMCVSAARRLVVYLICPTFCYPSSSCFSPQSVSLLPPAEPKSEQQLPSTKQLRTTRSLLPSSFYTVTTTATGGGGGVTVCGEGDKPHAVRTNELPTAPPAIVAEVTTTSYYPNGLNSRSLPFLVSLTCSQYICTGN